MNVKISIRFFVPLIFLIISSSILSTQDFFYTEWWGSDYICTQCEDHVTNFVLWYFPPIKYRAHNCLWYLFWAFFEFKEFYEGDVFTFQFYKPDGALFNQGSIILIWNPIWGYLDTEVLDDGLSFAYHYPIYYDPDVGSIIDVGIATKVEELNTTGIWRMEVYYNGGFIWADEVEVISKDPASRDDAFQSLDEAWAGMTLEKRKAVVKSLTKFNNFTSEHAYYTYTQIRSLVEEAKASNPAYQNISTELVMAMVWKESNKSFLSIGGKGELGFGQELIYDVTIDARQAFENLQKSNLTNTDFDDFKYNKIGLDKRSDPKEAISIMLKHIYELTKLSYIQNDPKKIIAGYNWGQGRLKSYLKNLSEHNIDESEWVDLLDQKREGKKWVNKITKKYILEVMDALEPCN